MKIVYANEDVPETFSRAIFLAGPTPRSDEVESWRPAAISYLYESGYDGVVFTPESRDAVRMANYIHQIEWEEKCLNMADCILFWIPRNLETMPAFTTNTEWGAWQNSGKVVFGSPSDAPKVSYQRYYADKLDVPISDTLEQTVRTALEMVGEGASRYKGERQVPLYIWRMPHFQQWYEAQRNAGNRLDGAHVEWTFRVGPRRKFILFWALHVNIWVSSENRNKSNEVVISRPDIATILMYRLGNTLADTDIVLIREFRSTAVTEDGFVWEIPGGSSFKPNNSPLELVAEECREETGLEIAANRMSYHGPRQIIATVSTHQAHLFSVELTEDELGFLRSQQGVSHGLEADTERTYVEVLKLEEILIGGKVDWSTLGMILSICTS